MTALLLAAVGFYRKGLSHQGCLLNLLMLVCGVSLLYLCSILNCVVTATWGYSFCFTFFFMLFIYCVVLPAELFYGLKMAYFIILCFSF